MIMVWISLRRMKSFIWTTSLLIICLAVDIIGCLQPNTEFSSPSVDSLKNCTAPKPPVANAMLKWRPGCNNNIFVPGENAEFVCKEGFRQIGWLDTLRCERNGTWSSKSSVEEFKSSKGRSDLSGKPIGMTFLVHCGKSLFHFHILLNKWQSLCTCREYLGLRSLFFVTIKKIEIVSWSVRHSRCLEKWINE